jgi:hypothetical protein
MAVVPKLTASKQHTAASIFEVQIISVSLISATIQKMKGNARTTDTGGMRLRSAHLQCGTSACRPSGYHGYTAGQSTSHKIFQKYSMRRTAATVVENRPLLGPYPQMPRSHWPVSLATSILRG